MDLPDPFLTIEEERIETPEAWRTTRRPELIKLFQWHVYGRAPVERPADLSFEVSSTEMPDSHMQRKQVDVTFSGSGGRATINLLLFLPEDATGPVDTFLLICHRDRKNIDPTREHREDFWPAEMITKRGYGAATFHVSDVDPDEHDGFQNGVHGIFPYEHGRPPDAWATIAAWAWGASRAMDYFETDRDVGNVAVVGHSRGGKASLWAGARDTRFSLVVSNNSGCTGAALARRRAGERIRDINRNFPHWFCDNYAHYNGSPGALPIDQHLLIALMAPRSVYVASASKDSWADPKGEFLSCVHATPVYELFGKTGLPAERLPAPNDPVHGGSIGYHLRKGEHDMTAYDWRQFMTFAGRHWRDGKD